MNGHSSLPNGRTPHGQTNGFSHPHGTPQVRVLSPPWFDQGGWYDDRGPSEYELSMSMKLRDHVSIHPYLQDQLESLQKLVASGDAAIDAYFEPRHVVDVLRDSSAARIPLDKVALLLSFRPQ